jgi:hypothetical protein
MFDGFSFDRFSLLIDGTGPTEVGTGGRHDVQVLVVAPVVVTLEERFDLGFKIAGQEVVLQQNAIAYKLMPALIITPSLARLLSHRTSQITQGSHHGRHTQRKALRDTSRRQRKKPDGNLLVRVKD